MTRAGFCEQGCDAVAFLSVFFPTCIWLRVARAVRLAGVCGSPACCTWEGFQFRAILMFLSGSAPLMKVVQGPRWCHLKSKTACLCSGAPLCAAMQLPESYCETRALSMWWSSWLLRIGVAGGAERDWGCCGRGVDAVFDGRAVTGCHSAGKHTTGACTLDCSTKHHPYDAASGGKKVLWTLPH